MNAGCVRDTLTGVCQHAGVKTQIVFVPVDGRKVFVVCLLLIAACVLWLALWLRRGHKFEEDV